MRWTAGIVRSCPSQAPSIVCPAVFIARPVFFRRIPTPFDWIANVWLHGHGGSPSALEGAAGSVARLRSPVASHEEPRSTTAFESTPAGPRCPLKDLVWMREPFRRGCIHRCRWREQMISSWSAWGRLMQADKTRTVIVAGAIGNVLEWYDFAIYGYFAASIGRTFFPKEDPVAQVLSAFGIFAVGFLMRPVGGALVGYIGDKLGRRAALTFSVAAMAIPTFLVGILPGYHVLGVFAPVALTLLRMIQGLSVGGEYTTSIVFMVEQCTARPARPDRRDGLLRRGRRHPDGLGDRCAAERRIAGRRHGGLGLAHSLPARPGGRRRRLLHPPQSRRERGPAGVRRIHRSATPSAMHDQAARRGWPACRSSTPSASTCCLSTS